jgi:hypothetical protein
MLPKTLRRNDKASAGPRRSAPRPRTPPTKLLSEVGFVARVGSGHLVFAGRHTGYVFFSVSLLGQRFN